MILESLEVNGKFTDAELTTNALHINGSKPDLRFDVVGDHVYTITNGVDTVVVAADMGNSHGVVLSITNY